MSSVTIRADNCSCGLPFQTRSSQRTKCTDCLLRQALKSESGVPVDLLSYLAKDENPMTLDHYAIFRRAKQLNGGQQFRIYSPDGDE